MLFGFIGSGLSGSSHSYGSGCKCCGFLFEIRACQNLFFKWLEPEKKCIGHMVGTCRGESLDMFKASGWWWRSRIISPNPALSIRMVFEFQMLWTVYLV